MQIVGITFLFMLFDIATGYAKAFKLQKLSSSVAREGIWHKAGYVALMALTSLLEQAEGLSLISIEVPALPLVCGFIIFTETISIFENICEMNPEIANSPLGKLLAKTKNNGQNQVNEGA